MGASRITMWKVQAAPSTPPEAYSMAVCVRYSRHHPHARPTRTRTSPLSSSQNVNGVYTADPRRVPEAFPIETLKYDEAIELAFFGAQVRRAPHPDAPPRASPRASPRERRMCSRSRAVKKTEE